MLTPFNWSYVDRDTLYMMLYSLKKDVVGKFVYIKDLHKLISKHLKSQLPIRVTKQVDKVVDKGYVYIGGTYYSDYDQDYRNAIEVIFSFHPSDTKIKISDYRWKRMCLLFADTILHEVIHMRQYRARNFKDIPGYSSTSELAKQRVDQNYYGHKDEIDAYAFNIACELYDRFGTNYKEAARYLETGSHRRHKRTSYYRYLKAFDFDHNHPVIKSLKKKIIRYLPYTEIGKPFKTTDWLFN